MFRGGGGLAAVSLALALQACSDEGGGDPEGPRPLPSSVVSSTAPAVSPTSSPASLDGKVEEARQALSREQGYDLDEIAVISADEVTWPNSGHGCPLTGATYEPGPFPGYRILLEADGQEFVYTGAEDSDPRLCLFLE